MTFHNKNFQSILKTTLVWLQDMSLIVLESRLMRKNSSFTHLDLNPLHKKVQIVKRSEQFLKPLLVLVSPVALCSSVSSLCSRLALTGVW